MGNGSPSEHYYTFDGEKIIAATWDERSAATGLYQGFSERDGEPVVCLTCNGTGAEKILYTPFIGRKNKRNVKVIRMSRGNFIATGIGGLKNTEMSYDEFKRRFEPPNI